MTPDLNVLLAASRTDHPHHQVALAWLKETLEACSAGGNLEILPMVAAGFLRLATNPRIFVSPTPINASIAFIDSLLTSPGVEMADLGREWPTLKEMCADHSLVANDITDAWIASAVRTLGNRLVTFDRGLRRLLGRAELTLLEPA